MFTSVAGYRIGRLLAALGVAVAVAACAGGASPRTSVSISAGPTSLGSQGSVPPTGHASAGPVASGSTAPEASGGTSHGDIPDNAVFLSYRGTAPSYSIQYVEGWQVSQQPNGVVIRDKDSSETVLIAAPVTDVASYVGVTDLPALRALPGFALIKQDSVQVGGTSYVHLAYHLPAQPDPVTGKQVPSTVDRYYVSGPSALAIVSLSTPDGVDNVDAFRQMITSFKWS